ncbi:MAG TPA: hypothetical protein VLZ07_12785 [Syntrophales bacterium]|nr:hypothetical protein [Syntrophales bacterium]
MAAIFCHICKKEVELVIFGNGLVGTCCNRVMYNSEDKPRFATEGKKKGRALSAVAPKRKRVHQARRS